MSASHGHHCGRLTVTQYGVHAAMVLRGAGRRRGNRGGQRALPAGPAADGTAGV